MTTMTQRTAALITVGAVLGVCALIFQPITLPPVRAQVEATSTPNPFVDALGTQAALNVQATQAANQQQQQAAQAQQAASAAQAQAAALQSQAYAAARQATAIAQQQQVVLIAAQATADAASLQATAIVQQTRTAIEIAAQQTRSALELQATQTSVALQAKATQVAIDATHTANEARNTENQAIATSVAVSLEATRVAIGTQHETEAAQAQNDQRTSAIQSSVAAIVSISAGTLAMLLVGKMFLRLWRSRGLNPAPRIFPLEPLPTGSSSAAQAVVDAATGRSGGEEVGPRLTVIELEDSPELLAQLLKIFDDD